MIARRLAAVVTLAAVLLPAGCGPGATARQRFEDSRVEVELRLEQSQAGTVLVAEFRPFTNDLHLYGTGLPITGIDGAGRPTRVELVDPAWRTVGAPEASVQVRDVPLAGFDEPFPIYPDGPVTLRQAIEPTGAPDDGRIEVTVTFMACSSAGLCYLPIVGAPMPIGAG